ncbi:unnamed protein product [Closterium sp. NIES-54]
MVTTTTPGGQRVSICTCTRMGHHLATFTRRPGSSQVAPPCSCRLLSHQTLLRHHRLGHPFLPRLCGMHSRLLVFGLPRSLPPLPPSRAPPCFPCVEGRQRAARHSSFPPTTAPLQTLHIDVWIGPRALLSTVRLQLRERFRAGLPVLRLHSDRGGEFSSDLLRDFCHGEGILQSFTLSESPQENGIAERRIGLVMEVTHTSMIHAAAPHFLWPFAVGDASVFRVWGSRACDRDTSADKLSARAIPSIFLGFSPEAPGWQFYHPTSRRVFPSRDVTFDESFPFYRLFPYCSAPPPPPPLFLARGPIPVDPLPPQGPAPSGVSQVDPLHGTAPVEVAISSGAAPRAASGGATSGVAEPGGAEFEGAGSGGAEPGGVETGGAEREGSEGAESGGAEPRVTASSGDPAGASPRLSPQPEPLSPQQLHEWFAQRTRLRSGAARAGDTTAGDTEAGGAGVTVGASGTGGAAATGPGGARTRGTGANGTGGVGGAGTRDPAEPGAAGAGGAGAVGARAGGTGVGGAGAGGAGAVDPGAGGAGGTVRPLTALGVRVPTVSRLLATVVTDPSFESTAASALVAELVDFAAACRLDYATALDVESESASPPSVGGDCALGTDVLEDRQDKFESLAATVPRFASMLLAPEGDLDAPDIPTLRSYAEAITGPYSSHWPAAMDAEMASRKSTGT